MVSLLSEQCMVTIDPKAMSITAVKTMPNKPAAA